MSFFNDFSGIVDQLEEMLRAFLEVAGFVLVVVGGLYCFAGYRLFKALLVITGFIVGGLIGMLLTLGSPIGFIIGAFIGALLFFILYFIGVFFMGAFLGILIVLLLSFIAPSPPALYLVIALLGGILAIVYEKLIMIISTSFIGASYLVLGGFLLMFGTIQIFSLSNIGLYPLLVLAFGLIGIVIQYGFFSKLSSTKKPVIVSQQKSQYIQNDDRSHFSASEINSERNKEASNSFDEVSDDEKYKNASNYKGNSKQQAQPDATIGADKYLHNFNLKIKQLNGKNQGKVYPITGEKMGIQLIAEFGRKVIPGNSTNIGVEDDVVSRKHLKFIEENGDIWITQYQVVNNTWVNGQELNNNESVYINVGDKINIGGVEFELIR